MLLKDQEKAKRFLERIYRKKRIPSALLFKGPEGVGKTAAALDFSRGLLCLKEEPWGCGSCSSCVPFNRIAEDLFEGKWEKFNYSDEVNGRKVFLYLRGEHPDFIFVPPAGQSLRIDQVRAVKDFVLVKPLMSRRKVVLIDRAEYITRESANALLKILEEPPFYAFIVLVASETANLLPTVLSRVYPVKFDPLDPKTLKELLPTSEENLYPLTEGSYTKAKALIEKPELLKSAEDFFKKDPAKIYEIIQKVEKLNLEDKLLLLDLLEEKIRDLLIKGVIDYDKFEMLLGRISFIRENITKGIKLGLALVILWELMED